MDELLEDLELAAFQTLLLDHLERGTSPEALVAHLSEHPDAIAFADYIATFDPRCVEVASRIVRKWAVRTGTST